MLASLTEVIKEARMIGGAAASINTPNLECLNAVLDAAEELDVPVIIAHAQCHEPYAPIDRIGPCMVELAKRAKVKVCVHLDHGEDFDYVKRAIALGFTSVMIDCSTASYEDNVALSRTVTEYAHDRGVDVEAELGALPQREGGGESTVSDPSELYTKPELVPDFISRTNIDALAIAFGTAHGIYKGTPKINTKRIEVSFFINASCSSS
jgi:fructose-bisphosphate aldolase class II